MKPIVDEIAIKFRDTLKTANVGFEGLYVFGSQINGLTSPNSDIDIVLLFKHDSYYLPNEYYEILSQMRYDYFDIVDLDIHTKTFQQLQSNPIFYNEVVNKGVFYSAI